MIQNAEFMRSEVFVQVETEWSHKEVNGEGVEWGMVWKGGWSMAESIRKVFPMLVAACQSCKTFKTETTF